MSYYPSSLRIYPSPFYSAFSFVHSPPFACVLPSTNIIQHSHVPPSPRAHRFFIELPDSVSLRSRLMSSENLYTDCTHPFNRNIKPALKLIFHSQVLLLLPFYRLSFPAIFSFNTEVCASTRLIYYGNSFLWISSLRGNYEDSCIATLGEIKDGYALRNPISQFNSWHRLFILAVLRNRSHRSLPGPSWQNLAHYVTALS